MYGSDSTNWKQSGALGWQGAFNCKTKETVISRMDGGVSGANIHTAIKELDDFLVLLPKIAAMSLAFSCLLCEWIDEHNTAEDVARVRNSADVLN